MVEKQVLHFSMTSPSTTLSLKNIGQNQIPFSILSNSPDIVFPKHGQIESESEYEVTVVWNPQSSQQQTTELILTCEKKTWNILCLYTNL